MYVCYKYDGVCHGCFLLMLLLGVVCAFAQTKLDSINVIFL